MPCLRVASCVSGVARPRPGGVALDTGVRRLTRQEGEKPLSAVRGRLEFTRVERGDAVDAALRNGVEANLQKRHNRLALGVELCGQA